MNFKVKTLVIKIFLCLFFLNRFFLLNLSASVSSSSVHFKNKSELKAAVAQWINHEDFRRLEETAEEIRKNKKRFDSGDWMLDVFYEGVRDANVTPSVSIRHIEAWRSSDPKSATALISLAEVYEDLGFKKRGGGYANSVSKKGWEDFQNYSLMAWDLLAKAVKLNPDDLNAYVLMLRIAHSTGLHIESVDSVFKEVYKREPLYFPLYRVEANFLLPQWEGEPGEMEEFLAHFSDETSSIAGDEIYTRAAYVRAKAEDDKFILKYNFSWNRIKQGFTDIDKRFPNSHLNDCRFFFMAGLFRDTLKAEELLKKIGDSYDEDKKEVFGKEAKFNIYKNWAQLRGELSGPSDLIVAIARHDINEIGKQISAGQNVNEIDDEGRTPLIQAIEIGYPEIGLLLIKNGADPRVGHQGSREPIHIVAVRGYHELIPLFLERGVNPNVVTKKGWSPLHLAAYRGFFKVVQELLKDSRVHVNIPIEDGRTALQLAVSQQKDAVINLLLAVKDIDVNRGGGKKNWNPLHWASYQGDAALVKKLLKHGADASLKTTDGLTALDIARQSNRPEVIEMIEKYSHWPSWILKNWPF